MTGGDTTYIIKTVNGEYYCGFTKNLKQRIKEHKQEKYPHWFCNTSRKNFKLVFKVKGDYENKIKKFGVKNFMRCLPP